MNRCTLFRSACACYYYSIRQFMSKHMEPISHWKTYVYNANNTFHFTNVVWLKSSKTLTQHVQPPLPQKRSKTNKQKIKKSQGKYTLEIRYYLNIHIYIYLCSWIKFWKHYLYKRKDNRQVIKHFNWHYIFNLFRKVRKRLTLIFQTWKPRVPKKLNFR